MLPLRSTSGWTTPAPAISRYVASPSFFHHSMSISTPGSTNGTYDGRTRIAMSSRSKHARDRVQPAGRFAAARQGDVDRLCGEPRVELACEDRVALRLDHRLDARLRLVDGGARRRALVGRELPDPLEELGERARFPEEARLRLLEVRHAR